MNIYLQSIDGFDDFLITGNGFEARAGIANKALGAAARGYQGTEMKYTSILFESAIIIMFDF